MDHKSFTALKEIRDKHGPREFGKIAQKLLGIALIRLCFNVKERSVEDVDIEAAKGEQKYWLEAKTTDKDTVLIQAKDVACLRKCKQLHGGVTGLAVLRVGLLADWVIAQSDNIKTGKIRIGSLSTYKITPLTDDVNGIFPGVLVDYKDQILAASRDEAQLTVNKLLKEEANKKSGGRCEPPLS
jgi:Holliday junction resolvase